MFFYLRAILWYADFSWFVMIFYLRAILQQKSSFCKKSNFFAVFVCLVLFSVLSLRFDKAMLFLLQKNVSQHH